MPGVTRAHSVRGSSRHPGPRRGGSARGAGLQPQPPMPLLADGQGPQPDGAAAPSSLEGRLAGSSCCLAPRNASGLNVTSRRSQDGRGSVAGAQVQKGRAHLAPLPPPSPPPSWWRVSSGNRGFRKTELLRPADGSKQPPTLPLPRCRLHLRSAPSRPLATWTGRALCGEVESERAGRGPHAPSAPPELPSRWEGKSRS